MNNIIMIELCSIHTKERKNWYSFVREINFLCLFCLTVLFILSLFSNTIACCKFFTLFLSCFPIFLFFCVAFHHMLVIYFFLFSILYHIERWTKKEKRAYNVGGAMEKCYYICWKFNQCEVVGRDRLEKTILIQQ